MSGMTDGASTHLTPLPEHKFSFGLWTVGNVGRDTFGQATRPQLDPADIVDRLGELGAYGVSFHDDDLIPPDSSRSDRNAILKRFGEALDRTKMVVSMATTNLFWDPVFKDGAFTSNQPEVRRYALAKTMRGIDLAAEVEAPIYVLWGGREGVEAAAAKPPTDALDRYREAINFLCGFVEDRGYDMRFALEPKPNEPRGHLFLPTVGHALAFITTLDKPEMVGVNPEVAHERMVGLSFHHALAQALWHRKLFHVDLNAQAMARYDQDFRFASEGLKEAFFVVKLLEESDYEGPRHFDAHPYRVELDEGIWQFALGCMRSYLILAEKAKQFADDSEIAEALDQADAPRLAQATVGDYDRERANELLEDEFNPYELAGRGFAHERLDQLLIELLLGVRK